MSRVADKNALPATALVPSKVDDSGDDFSQGPGSRKFVFFNLVPSWTISFFIHVVLLIVLAVWFLRAPQEPKISFEASPVSGEQLESIDVDLSAMDMNSESLEIPESPNLEDSKALDELTPTLLDVPESATAVADIMNESQAAEIGAVGSNESAFGETSSRNGDTKQKLLKEYGGTPESEECVELALEWLAKHQQEDGSWNFDHTIGSGNRFLKNPGSYTNYSAAATAFGLLPFLGSGYTHKEGKYQDVVKKALTYLIDKRGKGTSKGFSFFQADYSDDMYSHGLCSTALCEAYAMTKDSWLRHPAQGSLDFIIYAQHDLGGWRYTPNEQGDTSVVGWQIMALKSGKMAGLKVDNEVIRKASAFLDSVSIDSGSHYGYTSRPNEIHGRNKATTAIGLLCRMYMGWDRENASLGRGIEWLSDYGPYIGSAEKPKSANMYYNYYATQAIKQFGGNDWEKWNKEMRDFLVESQDTTGAERGSWFFPGGDQGTYSMGDPRNSGPGGRLYCTAMAAMTLEVYYRFLPLYKDKAVEEGFPLK